MHDNEFRLIFTDDERDLMCVAVYQVQPDDGQVALVDAWEAGPFDTRTDMVVRAVKSIVPLLRKRTRVLR